MGAEPLKSAVVEGLPEAVATHAFTASDSPSGVYVSLSGGEPLCHPKFWEIVEKLRQQLLQVTLTTNGTLLTKEVVRSLKFLGVNWVQLSLHSLDEAIHDKMMGKGSYKKILDAIDFLNDQSIGYSISSVITKDNINNIKFLEEKCIKNGVPFYQRSLLRVGRANDKKSVESDSFIDEEKKCYGFFAIQPNGDLQLCGECKLVLGNVFVDKIIDIWNKKQKIFSYCKTYRKCLAEEIAQKENE